MCVIMHFSYVLHLLIDHQSAKSGWIRRYFHFWSKVSLNFQGPKMFRNFEFVRVMMLNSRPIEQNAHCFSVTAIVCIVFLLTGNTWEQTKVLKKCKNFSVVEEKAFCRPQLSSESCLSEYQWKHFIKKVLVKAMFYSSIHKFIFHKLKLIDLCIKLIGVVYMSEKALVQGG